MMPIGLFEGACTYIRLVALVMGFIIFLAALFVMIRPLAKSRLYSDEDKRTRAMKLYLRGQEDQKGHLFWMLVVCAVVVWYIGAIIPSSYITNLTVEKTGDCQGTPEQQAYSSYSAEILYPGILFGIGIIFNILGMTTRSRLERTFHIISYLSFLIGTIWVVLLFRYVEVCPMAGKCM